MLASNVTCMMIMPVVSLWYSLWHHGHAAIMTKINQIVLLPAPSVFVTPQKCSALHSTPMPQLCRYYLTPPHPACGCLPSLTPLQTALRVPCDQL